MTPERTATAVRMLEQNESMEHIARVLGGKGASRYPASPHFRRRYSRERGMTRTQASAMKTTATARTTAQIIPSS